jgi:hypothetical protein
VDGRLVTTSAKSTVVVRLSALFIDSGIRGEVCFYKGWLAKADAEYGCTSWISYEAFDFPAFGYPLSVLDSC